MLDTSAPLILEINAHRLKTLAAESGNRVDLGTLPPDLLRDWREVGFDAIWVMGVWERGEAGRDASLTEPEFREEFNTCLPDWTEADVAGSPFAIRSYTVDPEFGGESALESLRQRLKDQGMGLMLDFVPNHTALDHPWVSQHPEYYVQGNEALLESEPWNYVRAGDRILAHGRDPYFPGWKDTLQLDYRLVEVRNAMIQTLLKIADRCDGVRCDMAMLLLREVFHPLKRDLFGRGLPSVPLIFSSLSPPKTPPKLRNVNPP